LAGSCTGNNGEGPQSGQTPAAPEPQEVRITITAVGDFLMHLPVIYSVHNAETGRFEFAEIFGPVRHLFADADYSIANLETRLAGAHRGYSGYPLFNCPADLAAEMRDVGLNMFLTANNHSLDQGVEGVLATIRHLEAAGLDHIGTHAGPEDRERPFITELRGIRVGIMNYTESTNGLPLPDGMPYLVNMIDRGTLQEEISRLKEARADIIIACLHFGVEYERYPTENQRELVEFLFNSGVDVVLGSHPHVVQPTLTRTVLKEGVPRKKFAAYSLGNFISNQRRRYNDSGLLVRLTVRKDPAGGVTVLEEVELVPVWVHTYVSAGRVRYRVLPVHEAIPAFAGEEDPLLTAADYERLLQVAEELGPDFLIEPP
jgi:poly-gamma-glutamate synthesis protein (capsule biosynthesis protein)